MSDDDEQVWDSLEGRLLEGRYRLDRRVAEGGFGVVFEGTHLTLNSRVAIKVLRYPPGISDDERRHLLSQFVAEGQLLPKLRHPNIVSALDVGTFELAGHLTAFMVLEWCDGRDLRDDLRRREGRGGRSVSATWKLLRPVVEALAHAHAAGFVHRDVKPANVMLVETSAGRLPKLIDFGIAKQNDALDGPGSGATRTRSVHRAFSVSYAAPEQVAGSKTGPWTDVHALGLLFTELLVDAPPFGDNDDVALAVIDPKRPTPAAFGVDVGPWEAVLARAVALRPADRQRDASVLLAELEEAFEAADSIQASANTYRAPSSSALALPHREEANTEGTILTASSSVRTDGSDVPKSAAKTARPSQPPTGPVRPSRYVRATLIGLGGVALAAVVGFTALNLERGPANGREPSSASSGALSPEPSFQTLEPSRGAAITPGRADAPPKVEPTSSDAAGAVPGTPSARASASTSTGKVPAGTAKTAPLLGTAAPSSRPSAGPPRETLY